MTDSGHHHFTLPPLPREPLWRVPVEPTAGYEDGELKIRAPTAKDAKRRARTLMGLTPAGEPQEVTDG